ncbi:MAG: hypothetical protein ACRCTZ_03235 [Sarcina sp.]
MERLEYWHTYINKNLSEPIIVNDEILRVTLVNQGKSKLSTFFTFKTKIEVLDFIKEVVLPSITISSFNPNDNISIYLREHQDVLDAIDVHTDFFNKNISHAYIESYNDINEACGGRIITQDDICRIVKSVEERFDAYNQVYLNLNYAKSTEEFLREYIDEYKMFEGLNILEVKLKENNLSVEKLENIIKDISNNQEGIRSLLDRLPF